jgi:predicted phage-related endonuclease
MKRFRSTEKVKAVQELVKIIKQRKILEAKEKMLKSYLKREMKDSECAIVDNWLITLTDKIKTTLDRKKLALELGEKLKKFEKITEYQQFDIKQIKEC